jgi:hypothetical protein
METREAPVGAMEKELKEWGTKLDALVAKADTAATEAGVDHRKRVDDLKAKYRVAQSKLDELKATGSDKWQTIETGVEGAWNELRAAFKELTN